MKKCALALVCLLLVTLMTGCAAVNGDNSFQERAPGEVSNLPPAAVTQPEAVAPAQAEPTATPTNDPNASGFNG